MNVVLELGAVAGSGRPVSQAPAFDALATPDCTRGNDVMAPRATASPSLMPASQVLGPVHRLQVVRVDAVPDTTEMIKVPLLPQWTMSPDVKRPVRQLGPMQSPGKSAVPIRLQGSGPQPAPRVRHGEPDPVVDQWRGRSATTASPPIMLLTETGSKSTGNTVRIVDSASDVHGHNVHQGGDAG